MHTYTLTHIHIHAHIHTNTCTHADAHYTLTHIHIHAHMRTHALIYTHAGKEDPKDPKPKPKPKPWVLPDPQTEEELREAIAAIKGNKNLPRSVRPSLPLRLHSLPPLYE